MDKTEMALKYIEKIINYLHESSPPGYLSEDTAKMLLEFETDMETTRLEDSLPDEAE